MTKQEFITRQKSLNDVPGWRAVLWAVIFLLVVIGWAWLLTYIDRHEELTWLWPEVVIGLIAFILVSYGSAVWCLNRQQKRFGHRCPNCGKRLLGFTARLAIATGNCGHCGEGVFDGRHSP